MMREINGTHPGQMPMPLTIPPHPPQPAMYAPREQAGRQHDGGGPGTPRGRHAAENRNRKERVKLGLALSMGAVVATGLMDGRSARTLHIMAGAALVGLSLWHRLLYTPGGR